MTRRIDLVAQGWGHRSRHTFWTIVVLGVLLLVAGCGSGGGKAFPWLTTTPPVAESTSVAPPVHYPEPRDRDPAAVLAALRQLDTCALIENQGVGPRVGFPAEASLGETGPHQCEYSGKDPDDTGKVTVAVGEAFDHGQRYEAGPIDAGGGARAYQRDTTLTQNDRHTCEVSIPVSFTLSVSIQATHGKHGGGDPCDQARAFAGVAVTKLGNPDAVRSDPKRLSALAQWDACTLLRAGLPPELRDEFAVSYAYYHTGIDECAAKELAKDQAPERKLMLLLSYRESALLALTDKTKQFNGATIKETGDSDGCELQWAHGKLDVKPGSKLAPYVQIRGRTCEQIEAVATAAMNQLAGAPPAVAPQRPLLIRTAEPDDPAAGPCVDFINSSISGYAGCLPAQDQPVPGGARALIDAATGNVDVLCAAAKPMVGQHFGDTLKPVTAGDEGKRYCVFVEPAHTVVVSVGLDLKHSPDAYATGPGVIKTTDVTVDGHRGISVETHDDKLVQRNDFAVYLTAPGGTVWLAVSVNPPRGAAIGTGPDTGKSSLLLPLATDFITRRFR